MADLKVRPKMDKPKLREAMTAPKDAASTLKKQYESQQRDRQPGQKSPERYATDRVESAVKGTTVLAAERMHQTAKKQHQQRKYENCSERGRTPTSGTESTKSVFYEAAPSEEHRPTPKSRGPQRSELCIFPDKPISTPVNHQETTIPAPPCAEERGRKLARAKYQTAQKQRMEAERWASQQELSVRKTSTVKTNPRVWEEGASNFSERKQVAHTPYAKGKLDRKTLAVKSISPYGGGTQGTQGIPMKPGHTIGAEKAVPHLIGQHRRFGPLSLGGENPGQRAKRLAQKKARRELLKKSAEAGRKAASAGGHTLKAAVTSVGRAVTKVVGSLSTTSAVLVLLVLFLLIIAIGGLTASPFGILFAGESAGPDAVPVSAAVAQVNLAFNTKLEELQAGDYDSVTVAGSTADWVEVLAIFAVKTAGSDTLDAMDVVTLDRDRIEKLEKVFLDMNVITTEVETIHHSGGKDDSGWTERILHIIITPRTVEEMIGEYRFTQQQQAALAELLEQRELLESLIGDLFHMSAEAMEVLEQLPEELSEERKAVIREACSLVGKVGYFWGGKSLTLGWDSRWGQLRQVTAAGSPTTGTYRPCGLDCSGFVDWVFYNATQGEVILGQGGGARMQHNACTPISWDEALPGDLVFYPDDTHVGIVCGRQKNGELLIVHCASGANNVVITRKSGFTSIGRPTVYFL